MTSDVQKILEIKRRMAQLKRRQLDGLRRVLDLCESNRILRWEQGAPLHLRWNPVQRKLLDALRDMGKKRFCVTGGNKLGKTALLVNVAITALRRKFVWSDEDFIFCNHDDPVSVKYVGQGWHDHIEATVIPELKKWWPKSWKLKTRSNGVIGEAIWTDVGSGGVIKLMSNTQDVRQHEGDLNDVVIFDEPPSREIYVASMRSLMKSNGIMVLGATLVSQGWVHRDIIRRKLADGSPDPSVFAVDGDSYQNVGYGMTKEGIDEFAKELTEEERQARIFGRPAYLSGMVLRFDVQRHCCRRFKVPTDWVVDIGIDVHPKKPQAVLFLATSPQNMKYFCDEIWEHGDGRYVADEIIRRVNRNGYRVGRVVIDPLSKADSNNDNSFFDIVRDRLAAHGMLLETASKDKQSGIIELNGMFETANGMPCLYVFDDLKRVIHDFEGWTYVERGDDAGKPSKVDDDMCENAYRLALLGTQWDHPDGVRSRPGMVVGDGDADRGLGVFNFGVPASRGMVDGMTGY